MLVPEAGIEPARLAAGDFESPASTNFTTRALGDRARGALERSCALYGVYKFCVRGCAWVFSIAASGSAQAAVRPVFSVRSVANKPQHDS